MNALANLPSTCGATRSTSIPRAREELACIFDVVHAPGLHVDIREAGVGQEAPVLVFCSAPATQPTHNSTLRRRSAGTYGIGQPKTSRHLAYLRRAGVVEGRKNELWVYYRLAEMEPVIKAVVDAAAHALSHLQTAGRDRKRLAARVSLAAPRLLPVAQNCCTPSC